MFDHGSKKSLISLMIVVLIVSSIASSIQTVEMTLPVQATQPPRLPNVILNHTATLSRGDFETIAFSASGNLLFSAEHREGFQVYDLSSPENPSVISHIQTVGNTMGLQVIDSLLFVAELNEGLHIYNVSNPAFVEYLGGICTIGNAYKVQVVDEIAYVADDFWGLQIVDVSDPSQPYILASYNTPGWARGVCVRDEHVFIADGSGIQVLDVSNKSEPRLLANYDLTGIAVDLELVGDDLYLANNLGVYRFDVSNPSSPILEDSLVTPGHAVALSVNGSYAYIADLDEGLQIVNITSSGGMSLVGSMDTVGNAWDVIVHGNHAYIADEWRGLTVAEISEPTNPTYVGEIDKPTESYLDAVLTDSDTLVCATGHEGFQVFDLGCPDEPTWLSQGVSDDHTDKAAFGSSRVCTAGPEGVLRVFSLADHSNPISGGSYSASDGTAAVEIDGDIAFVAGNQAGLLAIDVSDPNTPVLVSAFDGISGSCRDLYVQKQSNVAVVADASSGVSFVDVSDAQNPGLISSFAITGGCSAVCGSPGVVFAISPTSGLVAVDTADLSIPFEVGRYQLPWAATNLFVRPPYVFITSPDGLAVVDASDLTNMQIVAQHDMPEKAESVAASDSHAFVADQWAGLFVLRWSVGSEQTTDDVSNSSTSTYTEDPFTTSSAASNAKDFQIAVGPSTLLVSVLGLTLPISYKRRNRSKIHRRSRSRSHY